MFVKRTFEIRSGNTIIHLHKYFQHYFRYHKVEIGTPKL